jgi:tetratricopeptide (TPR) repeat protein
LAANCHLAKGNTLAESRAEREYKEAVKLATRSISVDKASRAELASATGRKHETPTVAADPYRIIATAYLRLKQPDLALKAALDAQAIDPSNIETYRQIADAYVAKRHWDDAAIALAQGAFATGSEALRQDLIGLYQQPGVDTHSCAVLPGPRGPALNPACELVRRDLCAATAAARRPELRQQLSCSN